MQLAVSLIRPRRLALTVGAVAVSVVVVVLACFALTRDVRQDINLADFAHARSEVRALDGYEEATDELCAHIAGCIQGFRATHAAFRKFDSTEDAATFARSTPGAYLSNWIVIQYTDGVLTTGQREQVQEMFDSTGTSD